MDVSTLADMGLIERRLVTEAFFRRQRLSILVLCSHYLFLYSGYVSLEQHIRSMTELCRVADEVRVYPLVTLDGKRSAHIDPVVLELTDNGLEVSFHKAKYRFQKGAEEMMVVK